MLEDFVKDYREALTLRLNAERGRYEAEGKDLNRDAIRGRIQGFKQALIDLDSVVAAYREVEDPKSVPAHLTVQRSRHSGPRRRVA